MLAAAKKHLETIRTSLADSSSLAAYQTADSTVTSGVTDTVSGTEYVSQIGYSTPVVATALALPIGTVSPVVEYGGSCFIVKPLLKLEIDSIPSMDAPEMQEIASQLRQKAAQKIYFDWYLNYKKRTKIKSNIDEIYLD
jgi:hypothetical protein